MTAFEFCETIWKLMENTPYDIYNDDDEDERSFCYHCPYHGRCDKEELFWSCPVWEEQMGEDL